MSSIPTTGRGDARFLERYGRWAVVTGASDGIGRAIAEELARVGTNLVLVARREAALTELAQELARRDGVKVRVVTADLGEVEDVARVLDVTAPLDVGLFVAAAGFGTSGDFLANAVDHELGMLDVNCRAVVAMSHAFGTRFVARGRGGIILLSSLLAFQGVPRAAAYAATKSFVQTFAEGIRLELAPHGVDVLAAAPGPVASGFAARAGMRMGLALRPGDVARSTIRALGRKTTVRPGWLSRLLALSLAALPRWGRTHVLAHVMRGFTKHKAGMSPARLPSAAGQ